MKRREFIAGLGGAVAQWPLAARAQQLSVPVIGLLAGQTPELFASRMRALHRGLSESGYIEGQNVAIEYRWGAGEVDRLPGLAADLVRRRVNVIITSGTASAIAATAATRTIPIVFSVSSDPARLGFIASLNHPDGNATGSTNLGVEVGPKRLELLHELLPAGKRVALLVNPTNAGVETQLKEHQTAARKLGLQLEVLRAKSEQDIESAFAALLQMRADALVIGPDSFFNAHDKQLAALALRYGVPAIHSDRPFVAAGGLISYGASIPDQYRLAGNYAGRILMGEKPGDLPVQQSTKVELIINLKTAKALGITIPETLLATAEEVIE
jgi:putative tryptophan/tyrosine transport system substrate-binding protein